MNSTGNNFLWPTNYSHHLTNLRPITPRLPLHASRPNPKIHNSTALYTHISLIHIKNILHRRSTSTPKYTLPQHLVAKRAPFSHLVYLNINVFIAHLLISSFIYLSNPIEKTPMLGHVHTNPGIFETAYFYPDPCGRGFFKNRLESGFKTVQLSWQDSLVSWGGKADSCRESMHFQKYSDSCGRWASCTEENRLPTNKNFIQTQRVSASAFIRGLYIGFINPLMISYCDVIKKCSLLD